MGTGILLNSKESVLSWYQCREVFIFASLSFKVLSIVLVYFEQNAPFQLINHFRAKIHVRLDAVMVIIFTLPVLNLAVLGVSARRMSLMADFILLFCKLQKK